ncbi:Type 1 glutamine amidotransferase-like domain-containing protein [Lysinibacillus fusiformis]|uniref:Type 1 glutamine amidotransferase-like domain-containing protein n=1 Tax=Lysinibacillus fusiformis TaxID=28031 RepID=UPI002152A0B9|nr:Type 1 glutamine amidotransferase-like domain-containing protein [Lysinibacillus fusiformis]
MGITSFLVEKWRQYRFHEVLKEAYQKGIVLAGIGAGAMCWFEKCYSENINNGYEGYNGLGMLPETYCPY